MSIQGDRLVLRELQILPYGVRSTYSDQQLAKWKFLSYGFLSYVEDTFHPE